VKQEIFRYLLIGLAAVIVDYVFLFILRFKIGVGTLPSVISAFLISASVHFFMNLKYTFKVHGKSLYVYLFRYFLAVIASMGLTIIIVNSLMTFGFHLYFSKLIAIVSLIVINFFVSKYYVF